MHRDLIYRMTFSICLFCLLLHGGNSSFAEAGDEKALTSVVQDLCHSQVVMLGESATHEDGHTHAFKVALVERLVNKCGFDSIFFEASHYEFINLNNQLRNGQSVTTDEISSAVGGLWKFNQEFQPLIPFLLEKVQAGQLFLGGIDDQLGQAGQDYANIKMVSELTNLLPRQQRQACSVALHKRIYSDYPQASPYSQSDRSQIDTCLSDIYLAAAMDKTVDRTRKEELLEMISTTQRWISRDFSSDAEYMVNRDRSMFQNFEWLRKQQPTRHKVIIWAATVHIAKQGNPTWGDHTGANFGSIVHQKYGIRAFSLGFSALTGSYRQGRHDIHNMPAAPLDSVEARALHGEDSDATYVGSAQLTAMGTVPGAFFQHSYQTLFWPRFLDGVVVFREEHPPSSTSTK